MSSTTTTLPLSTEYQEFILGMGHIIWLIIFALSIALVVFLVSRLFNHAATAPREAMIAMIVGVLALIAMAIYSFTKESEVLQLAAMSIGALAGAVTSVFQPADKDELE